MNRKTEKDIHWSNPKNWKLLSHYISPDDKRIIVPGRFGVGVSLNLGHPIVRGVIFWFLMSVILCVIGGLIFIGFEDDKNAPGAPKNATESTLSSP